MGAYRSAATLLREGEVGGAASLKCWFQRSLPSYSAVLDLKYPSACSSSSETPSYLICTAAVSTPLQWLYDEATYTQMYLYKLSRTNLWEDIISMNMFFLWLQQHFFDWLGQQWEGNYESHQKCVLLFHNIASVFSLECLLCLVWNEYSQQNIGY